MKQIHKYRLPMPNQSITLEIQSHKIVYVDMQHGEPMVWLEFNSQLAPGKITIRCVGTGWDIPDHCKHIGTIIDAAGFVWHYYSEPI